MDLAASWAALEREEKEKELELLRQRVKELEDQHEEIPFDGGSRKFNSKKE